MPTSFENPSPDMSNSRAKPESADSRSKSSSSCSHCVNVVREILGGLNRYAANENSSRTLDNAYSRQQHDDRGESPPLTLLKAIAGKQNPQQNQPQEPIQVENTHDGLRITLPVSATVPSVLRRWNSIAQKSSTVIVSNGSGGKETSILDDESSATHGLHALATSPSSPVEKPLSALSSADDDGEKKLTVEVKCRPCASSGPEGGARAFLMGPTPTSIVLCQNRIQATHHEVEEILTHELVHLFDLQNLKLDLQKCENLAYSEVRAAKAAECRDTWSQYMKSYCVKQKAICATNNLFPTEGRKCIQKVFEHAYEDNRPFQ